MNSNHALVREEVQADAELCFTRKHKTLRLQLPDLQYANIRVDFSSKVFSTVKEIARFFGMLSVNKVCKFLGIDDVYHSLDIRRPEELSLLKVAETSVKYRDSSKHGNGSGNDGLIAPNVLNPSMTPTSPYTPGLFSCHVAK